MTRGASAVIAAVAFFLTAFALSVPPALAESCKPLTSGDPCILLTPDAGPFGTHVQINGRLTKTGQRWRSILTSHQEFMLVGDFPDSRRDAGRKIGDCEINVGVGRPQIHISADGDIRSLFEVRGGTSVCKMTSLTRQATPGLYYLTIGCQSCSIATFTITPPSSLAFTGGRGTIPMAAVGLACLLLGAACVAAGRRRDYLAEAVGLGRCGLALRRRKD